ncbi:unnamed protein product [Chondrus crispus]|uniref:Uncharacterized protein n=1 Tax=Chondrus crispus TaxID=2769 RepID=R7QKV8_CHOCR|nr:unnamed protein product [Chondrus crispus]CDF38719.1 unnamed protein product [Chondrus crispus]|eukprot:XP_005718624.1 unnamed protein product [Chondrus crispus]
MYAEIERSSCSFVGENKTSKCRTVQRAILCDDGRSEVAMDEPKRWLARFYYLSSYGIGINHADIGRPPERGDRGLAACDSTCQTDYSRHREFATISISATTAPDAPGHRTVK